VTGPYQGISLPKSKYPGYEVGLIKHIDELRILLVNYPVDILSINETKLDNSINDCEIHIPGYEILRRHRDRHGGGVCFYIRTTINFSIREDLKFKNLENLCVEIRKPQSKTFVVVNWYRPPKSPVELFTSFESLIGRFDAENVEFYLMGDFNCNLANDNTQYDNNTHASAVEHYRYIWSSAVNQ
jgi:exonuclease III